MENLLYGQSSAIGTHVWHLYEDESTCRQTRAWSACVSRRRVWGAKRHVATRDNWRKKHIHSFLIVIIIILLLHTRIAKRDERKKVSPEKTHLSFLLCLRYHKKNEKTPSSSSVNTRRLDFDVFFSPFFLRQPRHTSSSSNSKLHSIHTQMSTHRHIHKAPERQRERRGGGWGERRRDSEIVTREEEDWIAPRYS